MAFRARGKEIINSIASVSTGKLPLYKKLWENPAPTSAFAAQTITLLSDDYDFLLVIYRRTGTYTDSEGLIIPKGANATLSYANATGTGAEGRIRTMVYNSDTSYTFGEAYEASGTSARTTNNLRIVPTIIYGFKKNIDIQSVIASVSTEADKCMMSDGVTNVEDAIESSASEIDTIQGNIETLSRGKKPNVNSLSLPCGAGYGAYLITLFTHGVGPDIIQLYVSAGNVVIKSLITGAAPSGITSATYSSELLNLVFAGPSFFSCIGADPSWVI